MMRSVEKAANAMGGRTARACDCCLRWRARWFCPADDAFLCQACDASVHSANQLARRHERIRLEMASSSKTVNSAPSPTSAGDISPPPAWHLRKARTPRQNNNNNRSMLGRRKNGEKENETGNLMEPVVPEMGKEEVSMDENELDEHMICRVPVFDPFEEEFCSNNDEVNGDLKVMVDDELEGFNEFLPSDLDLAEFAADVESLLGAEIEDEAKGIETSTNNNFCNELHEIEKVMVKEELEEEKTEAGFDVLRVTTTDFNYESPVITGNGNEAEEDKALPTATTCTVNDEAENSKVKMKRERLLRLNYESVIAAWASQGSPWMTGIPPEFKPGVCWPDFPECYPKDESDYRSRRQSDGEREARVSRYREKRRTRLFSKKIRYEVRKLNAEKRPRMKGRFVKRTSFMGDFSCFSVY